MEEAAPLGAVAMPMTVNFFPSMVMVEPTLSLCCLA